VDWTTSTFADGASVDGYLVARYDARTNAPASIGADCSGTITALTCTENAVDPGPWYYTITPKHLAWLGGESPASATITVASPSLTFSSATTIAAPPSVQQARSPRS
jgi:hypothetical protein